MTLVLTSKVESHLDRVSTGSDSDLVKPVRSKPLGYCMLIIDQVAIAPCTDPIQECFRWAVMLALLTRRRNVLKIERFFNTLTKFQIQG